ncbi:MAG: hypothetical protein GEU73_09245 [Chloroflexi bacterium]|nr:hypothetical protein [Chloroflexota bacterium]
MRVLLDESVPRGLKAELPGHEVWTVAEMGWTGRKNGELLRLADERFDVFVTMDRHLPAQQNLGSLRLSIAVLLARSNDITDLRPIMPKLRAALDTVQAGQLLWVVA